MSKSIAIYVFPLEVLWFQVSAFKSFIYFEFIFVHSMRGQFSWALLHVTVQFLTLFTEKAIFFPTVYSCLLCHGILEHVSMGSFLSVLFCFTDLCVCVCVPIKHCSDQQLCSFDQISFAVQFEITEHDTSMLFDLPS